ncbi:hypothetical protein EI94DRAFT_1708721 [Lactarius quietus]|nr:hypothetical protein EI94DRAFT_1708721 [Lactarius quietus]
MNLTICHGDRTNISNQEYVNIQRVADIICQALLQCSEAEAKAASNHTAKPSSDVKDSQPSEPFTVKLSYEQVVLALEKQHPAEPIVPSFLSCTNNLIAEAAPAKPCPVSFEPTAENLVASLISQFPSLTSAPCLLKSMDAQPMFKQSMLSEQVTALLERVQFADPTVPNINKDNVGQSWGHYQFTAGGISPSSFLTSWEDVGNVATAFKLFEGMSGSTAGFISNIYLEQILNCLEKCWTDTSGTLSSQCHAVIPITPTYSTFIMSNAISPPEASVSPQSHSVKLTFKQVEPIPDMLAATQTSNAPKGSNSTIPQQPSAGTESTWEPLAGLDKGGTHTDVLLLKLLQVPELQGIFADMKPSAPKPKCKDDLVAIILNSPEFASVSQPTIQDIIEKVEVQDN